MTIAILGIILAFLMVFNVMLAKSFLVGLAISLLTVYLSFNTGLTYATNGTLYYFAYAAGILIIGFDLIFMVTKSERI